MFAYFKKISFSVLGSAVLLPALGADTPATPADQAAAQPPAQSAPAPAPAQPAPAPATPPVQQLIIAEPIDKDRNEPVGPIVLRGTDVGQVLELIQQYSGRVIIASDGLTKNRLSFNSNGLLPRDQAIYALESLLAANGVMLIRGEGRFVRATPMREPARRATPLIDTVPQDAQSGQVFTKTFTLKYVSPRDILPLVRDFTSGNQTSKVHRVDSANAIMVVDTLSNLSAIERLIAEIDQPSDRAGKIYTFDIVNGDASRIRDTLRQIQRSSFAAWLGDATVWVDARTNKLIVVTREENHKLLSNLIADLDQAVAPFTTSKVIEIKQGSYWSIWHITNTLVRSQQNLFRRQGFRSSEQTVTTRTVTMRNGEEVVEETTAAAPAQAAAQGAQAAEGQQPQQPVANATAAASGSTQQSVTETLMMEGGMPELQFSPYISLFPDSVNNVIVVYGTHSDIERMEKLIKQLDIKSVPYVTSELVEIKHAQTRDLSNLLNFMINSQRRTFQRRGLQSGTNTQQGETLPEAEGFQFSDFATIAADWRLNSILIYGTRQDISQLKGLIDKMDTAAAPLTRNEVVYLKHARADNLAHMIFNVINYQRSVFNRQRNVSQAQAREEGADVTSLNSMGFEFSDYAVVYADRRSNALFAYGTASDIVRIQQMITNADIPVEPMTQTQIFPLRHTDANQSASIIQRIVNAQRQALRQVRSQGREVPNPATAAQESAVAMQDNTPVAEGEESLQFSPFMTVTPDVRSNSLVVYGTHGDVEQIKDLLSQIDIEVAPFTRSQVFFLKSAQSNTLIGILNNIVRGQERAISRVRSRNREIQNTRGTENLGTGAEDSALQFSPYVTIVENRRNNAIIVYGTPADISQISKLIETNDVAIAPYTQTETFLIRHADARDTARTITTLINQQQRVREREATLQRVFRQGNRSREEDTTTTSDVAGTTTTEVSQSEQTVSDDFDPNAGADLQFSPYVSLVADERSNAVIAYGTQFDLQQIGNLISQIDKVLPQVRIEVVIAEVRLQGNQVSGLSSFGINYRNPFDFQRVKQTTGGVTNEQIIGTTGMNTSVDSVTANGNPAFDLGLSLNDFSLQTVFRVAQEDQNVKVLSAPTITTTHNRRAQLNVGESRPIITGTTTSGSSDLVTRSTVEYRDIGITLRVRPMVSESGAIQMELEQIVETVIDTQTIDRNVQPIISTRRASSFVSVKDREIIIMGGLQSVETTKKEGKVFILGDIPLLGELFRPERDEEVVRELIIFIRPYLVNSQSTDEIASDPRFKDSAVAEEVQHFLKEGRLRQLEKLKDMDKKDDKADDKDQSSDAAGDKPAAPKAAGDEEPSTPEESAAAQEAAARAASANGSAGAKANGAASNGSAVNADANAKGAAGSKDAAKASAEAKAATGAKAPATPQPAAESKPATEAKPAAPTAPQPSAPAPEAAAPSGSAQAQAATPAADATAADAAAANSSAVAENRTGASASRFHSGGPRGK